MAELAADPALKNRWVAIDPNGVASDDLTPIKVALRSGAVVVDADDELGELCRRLSADNRTSLTIVFAGGRA
jgi:hypothetical protein